MALPTNLVVRLGIYPHQVDRVLACEKQALATIGAELRFIATPGTEDDIIAAVRQADGILNSTAQVTRRIVESLERCKVIVQCSVGTERVDVAAATDRGIAAVNLPDMCTDEVADQAMALLLACNRKIVRLNNRVRGGIWDRKILEPMPRLAGTTIGLLAFGRIAQAMAARAKAFGMRVVAYDPFVPDAVFQEHGVERRGLDDLLRQSDFISSHLPFSPMTCGLLGERELRLMKSSAVFVNTSRGGVVDEPALIRALQEGRIAGAGLDVLVQEPPDPSNPLIAMENVIVTPHSAGYSDGVVDELCTKPVAEVISVLQGHSPRAMAFLNPQVKGKLGLRD